MTDKPVNIEVLTNDVRACRLCEDKLDTPPNPVFQCHPEARILIAGQAPGARADKSGIPFSDASGVRLREWLGIDEKTFYSNKIAILPMGFCYPGKGKSGDKPPRPECAKTWREPMLSQLNDLALTLVIGRYALAWHLPQEKNKSLTDVVSRWQDFGPGLMPLPHPSPRNLAWFRNNPWFEADLLPELRTRVRNVMNTQ